MKGLGLTLNDINGCPKLFNRYAFQSLNIRSTDWFIDAEVMLKATDRKLKIQAIPAVMTARQGGASKVNWKTCLEFVRNSHQWKQKR